MCTHTHTERGQHTATIIPVCSVYAVGFRKPFRCLGLLLAWHVGEDSDIFLLFFTKHKQSSLSSLYPLPLSTLASRCTRNMLSAAKSVRVGSELEGLRSGEQAGSVSVFFQSQSLVTESDVLESVVFYELNSSSSFHSMKKTSFWYSFVLWL